MAGAVLAPGESSEVLGAPARSNTGGRTELLPAAVGVKISVRVISGCGWLERS